jgi:hypothetical protein
VPVLTNERLSFIFLAHFKMAFEIRAEERAEAVERLRGIA